MGPRAPKSAPRAPPSPPKRAPRAAQERPRAAQEPPKSAQECPNSGQERPKSSQEHLKSGQELQKEPQRVLGKVGWEHVLGKRCLIDKKIQKLNSKLFGFDFLTKATQEQFEATELTFNVSIRRFPFTAESGFACFDLRFGFYYAYSRMEMSGNRK